ncbi:zinc finger protein 660-like [Ictalurus furcatus]|uniref:zinc finger protein 660-like n=1 Tax=Ictalurus furcatus TaxID=66913 RepID=UPI00235079BB|nr:zinc finger protein 660-like [Ictalurus furcatus]
MQVSFVTVYFAKMVLKCAFPGCQNLEKSARVRKSAFPSPPDERLTFHRFPVNDPERLKLWLLSVHQDITLPLHCVRQMRLCSQHFTPDDFRADEGKIRRYLKKTAVPVMFIQHFKQEDCERELKAELLSLACETSPKRESSPTPVTTCSEVEKSSWLKVMQDCQSCGHDSDLKSHPASAEPAQTFINGSEHTLKCEDDKEVVVQIVSSDNECSEQVFIEKDGSYLSSDDEEASLQEEEVKKKRKRKSKSKDSSDEWEPGLDEEATDSDVSNEETLKEDGQGNLVVWCIPCGTEASLSCSVHGHKKVFCCARCGAGDDIQTRNIETLPVRFDDVAGFQKHAEQEHGAKPFYTLCQDCGKFFTAKKEHVCEHKIKFIVCPECGKRFLSEAGLKLHRTQLHSDYDHPCKFCLKVFKTKSAKLEHEQTHPKESQPYRCPDCPKRFSNIHKRNRHVRSHRGSQKNVCDVCKKSFKDAYRLKRHKLIHSGEQPFKCQVCERSFNQMVNLTSHMRVHTGEKPFTCEQCGESFSHNVSLRNHKQRHHDSGGQSDE